MSVNGLAATMAARILAAVTLIPAMPAAAQVAAAVPPSPAPEPQPSPFAVAAPQGEPPTAADAEEGDLIRTVTVAGRGEGALAVAPEGWTPPADRSGTFTLSYRPGEALDRAWVERQFVVAGEAGLRPSTAVAIVQLINRAYVSAGFINSGILVRGRAADDPAKLGLELVFGRLSAGSGSPALQIEFKDGRKGGLDAGFVEARFAAAAVRPLNAFDLERDFRLLDESDSIRSISAALVPGSAPGEAQLKLLVNPAERADIYAGASNDRSPSVGEKRAFAGAFVRNLLLGGDRLTGEAGITRGVKDWQVGYRTPLFLPQLSIDGRVSFNDAAVIASALAPLDIKARDRNVEAGASYRFIAEPLMMRGASQRWSPSQSLDIGLHWLRRKQKSFLLGEPFSFAPGSVDGRAEYRAVRLSADYIRRDQRRVIALSLGATYGLDGTRSDVPGIPNPRKHFAAYLGQLNVAQSLGENFELRGRITAQLTRGTLYSGLRLPVGGFASVRGYRETLFLVDRGAIGSLEIARSFSLTGKKVGGNPDIGAFSASLFADAAQFGNADSPKPGQKWIASIGAGLMWTPSRAIQAGIAYGHALKDVPVPGNKSLQDRGVHFRIVLHPLQLI